MDITKARAEIIDAVDGDAILKKLEMIGRVAHKSEGRITENSAPAFVSMLVHNLHHESVIEHVSVTVRFICDRGVSHEMVRHRIASYTQESTRYCDYQKAGSIQVIAPLGLDDECYEEWKMAMEFAEDSYLFMRSKGVKAQIARDVLPTSLKTEVVMTANLREWRHFFKERTSKAAHPQMREVATPLLAEFKRLIPVIFDDIEGVL